MLGGYTKKILWVNLTVGEISVETPDEKLYRDFLGGYGIGANILYNRMNGGVDPLGPENILGFVTGPATGTLAVMGSRYTVVAKSPLTSGWGDANAGGSFGPYLKLAGYDGIFFTGISARPVYLFINNGKAELRDASNLWGKDTYETEKILLVELGEDTKIACIGPSGEKLSLISCIISNRGAAAARSGLGAVMGSKKLKAVAVIGNHKVPIANAELLISLRKEHIADLKKVGNPGMPSFFETHHKLGTSATTHLKAQSGDSPVKNWGGVGIVDLPEISGLSPDAANANVVKREGCWHCPIGCVGILGNGKGEYKYPSGTRRPQYETQAAFGSLCLNNDAESLAMVNHICNSNGLDTISAGGTIAFAIECFENGIITKKDTDGIELTWGNHPAIVAMTEKLARRENFGNIIADGVKKAAERIGKGSEAFAIHIGGQELGMHDPKLGSPPFNPNQSCAARYQMDATPGRHTADFGPTSFISHIVNAAGLCSIGYLVPNTPKYLEGYMRAITGLDQSFTDLLNIGERIAILRHVFNLREGINPLEWKVNPRIIGNPPQKVGPLAGVSCDIEAQIYWNLGFLDWDRKTTKPSKKKLYDLGLDDIAQKLYEVGCQK